jgi:HEPN domain-containing protein
MEKIERVKFWTESAERDFKMMEKLYKSKDYMYALFFGQLGAEKMFKAIYIKVTDMAPPYVHDLAYLAGKCNLDLDKIRVTDLKEIGGFNINARYDDYKKAFYFKANAEYTKKYVLIIRETEKWLKKEILKK